MTTEVIYVRLWHMDVLPQWLAALLFGNKSNQEGGTDLYNGPRKRKEGKSSKVSYCRRGFVLMEHKTSLIETKFRNSLLHYRRSSSIRACMNLLLGPATTVLYIRRYVIREYIRTRLYCTVRLSSFRCIF